MTTYNVLVPLDGSPFSSQILASVCRLLPPQLYALHLLRVEAAPLGVVSTPRMYAVGRTAIPDYDTAWDAALGGHPIYANQVEESLEAELKQGLYSTAHVLGGYDVTVAVRFGDAVEEILKEIETHNVDLVAMATHGRGGMRRLLVGSVAAEVVRRSPVPVLLLRPDPDVSPARRSAERAAGTEEHAVHDTTAQLH